MGGIPVALLLAGYWLVARLPSLGAVGRLAAALPAGMASLLLFISVVNFFRPLDGGWAWFCLLPCTFTLAEGRARRGLFHDLATLLRERRRPVKIVAGCAVVYLAFLLWPLIRHPNLAFYDGTSNNDSFFWITNADYLRRHTYMQIPVTSASRPLANNVGAIIGLRPVWGRMGAEGLLALTSSIVNTAPLKIYVYATVSLYFVWLAGVFIVLKTFIAERLDGLTLAAAVLLQPLFVFFQSNSNLPNLVGALIGALLIVATARMLADDAAPGEAVPWMIVVAFSVQAMLCSYPEIAPFVFFPCGLLWLRGVARRRWMPVVAAELALGAGLLLNWVTTVRAVRGFIESFVYATTDAHWGNLFHAVIGPEMPSTLTTLTPAASTFLGPWFGSLLTIVLAAALVLLLRKARDPLGLGMALGGSVLLLAYTIDVGFIYGWQKTAEFGGVVIGATFPAGCISALRGWWQEARSAWRRGVAAAGIGLLALFYGNATCKGARETYYWAEHKHLLREVSDLRDSTLPALNGHGRVLVVTGSFFIPFFHSMWAAYCLPRADLVFSARDAADAGGYLHRWVRFYHSGDQPAPAAIFESRAWADTVDANLPRLLSGESFAVLRNTNEVLAMHGLLPDTGVPRYADAHLVFTVRPHVSSWLHLQLALRDRALDAPAEIEITSREAATGRVLFQKKYRGVPPWRVDLPLQAGVPNRIEMTVKTPKPLPPLYPLLLQSLKITGSR